MTKVAITGASGLVGSRIVELLARDFTFIDLPETSFDIREEAHVHKVLSYIDYDIFLHLAAYTNVDKAQNVDKELAYKLNVEGTRNVFEATSAKKKKFIYISTDYVFDGTQEEYFESSTPNPLNVYGQTKYEGEQIVGNNGMIVRISFPYRKEYDQKKDFVYALKGYLQKGKELSMITDSVTTPTFIDDIAYALKYLMQNYSSSIFHINGGNSLSPYEQAIAICAQFNLDRSLVGKTTFNEFYKYKAPRPQYSRMKSEKNNFYKMKSFEEGLRLCG